MSEGAVPKSAEKSARGRKHERHSCRLRLRCRRVKGIGLYESTEKYVDGMIRNRSSGGFLLESPIWFPEGAKLEIAFKSPDDKDSFLGIVTVRWVKRYENFFQVGVSTDKLQTV